MYLVSDRQLEGNRKGGKTNETGSCLKWDGDGKNERRDVGEDGSRSLYR